MAIQVEERFALRTIPIDINGQELGAMGLVDAKNVYSLKALSYEGRRMNRVEVMLQSHTFAPNAASFSEQDPWQKALAGGWLELGQPSIIERHGEDWCFVARKCPAPASAEYQFLDALGSIVVMMMPLEKLQTQLDHKQSDGTLSLEYADTAAFMVGEKNAPKLQARQLGSGIPAQFELRSERRDVSVRSAATSSVKLPKKSSKASRLETVDRLTVDRDCRIRNIDLTVSADYSLVPNTPSAIRMQQIHERKLSLQ